MALEPGISETKLLLEVSSFLGGQDTAIPPPPLLPVLPRPQSFPLSQAGGASHSHTGPYHCLTGQRMVKVQRILHVFL